jgi:small-conductance mechanosensitive channel
VDGQQLLAASAALGVALGFAAQDLLKNIFGGLIVVFDQPFQVGDKISVGGTYGEVVAIGLRSTRIVTPDDNLVTVPNSQVVLDQVANANAGELNCQVVTDLFLPGWVDERRVKEIAFEAAVNSQYVFLDKPIVVLVEDEFRETFLTHVKVKAYVLDPRFEFLLRSDITERAKDGFRASGLLPEHALYPLMDPSASSPPPEPIAP